jgi:LPS O-antigen subunit length determinant protein (WzzB/FepE family)
MEQQKLNYYVQDELDEDLNIDLKKIFFTLWSRKFLICKIFASVFVFFILLTFILPKKWQVDADLYINKSNNTNMAEINPYFIEEVGMGGGMAAMLSGGGGNL